MNIGIVVKKWDQGNPSNYLRDSFTKLGHKADILTEEQFYGDFDDYDFLLCVDSAEPVNILDARIMERSNDDFKKIAYWFIDFRHNKTRESGIHDSDIALVLATRGAQVYQAQYEDNNWCGYSFMDLGLEPNTAWLPLAADPQVWCDEPVPEKKSFDLAFVGGIYDKVRQDTLLYLNNLRSDFRFGVNVMGVWKKAAADFLRQSKIGFNINTGYTKKGNSEWSYDVNMRFFETLSCGIPLITNYVPKLHMVLPEDSIFVKTYSSISELPKIIDEALTDKRFLNSGSAARQYILHGNTYDHRAEMIINNFQKKMGKV